MDIISHGLRGSIAFGRENKKQFWLSFAFGILPDFASFGIVFVVAIRNLIWGHSLGFGPGTHTQPSYVHTLYNITHSLVTRAVVFGILQLIFRKPVKATYARLIHILLDIPTHSLAFFATPFLWPLSNFKFDGIPRSNKRIFIPNIIVLIIVYSIYLYKKWKRKK